MLGYFIYFYFTVNPEVKRQREILDFGLTFTPGELFAGAKFLSMSSIAIE